MKNFIFALLVATAATEEWDKKDDMKGMDASMEAKSLERMCWEWDQMECDMMGMRCAKVQPDIWDFYSTEEGKRLDKDRNEACNRGDCNGWEG